MGNIGAYGPSGSRYPSQWYPVADGNYSTWRSAFEDQTSKHCSHGLEFEVQRSAKSNSLARSVFNSWYGGKGSEKLRNAIHDSKLGTYIGGKAGSIVLIAFGIFAFILSVLLVFAVLRAVRNCFGKTLSGCRERQRQPPVKYEGYRTRMLIYKSVAFISFALLLGLGIAFMFYAAAFKKGFNSTTCDFWLSTYGHFFGVEGLAVPDGAVQQWNGTVAMWDKMSLMSAQVNPMPDGPDGTARCQLCDVVEADYSGPGGLIDVLNTSRTDLFYETNKAILVAEMLTTNVAKGNWKNIVIDTVNNEKLTYGPGTVATPMGSAMANLARSYSEDLANTTDDGIILFRQNIDEYMGRNSVVLSLGYNAAQDALAALLDVNYLLAKILVMWHEDVFPMVKGLVITLLVLTLVIACFNVIVGIFGFSLMFLFEKECRQNRAAGPRMTKLLGVLYGLMIFLAGFSFLLFTILCFAASAGSDACRFIDFNLYAIGDWDAFPSKLLGETVTNKTAMSAVLDTCVMRTGDGDVAGALGLRMGLDRVKQTVDKIRTDMVALTEKTLQLDFRVQKTETVAQVAQEFSTLIGAERMKVGLGGLGGDFAGRQQIITTAPLVSYNPRMSVPTAHLRFIDGVFGIKNGGNIVSLILGLLGSLSDPFMPVVPLQNAVADVNGILSNATNDAFPGGVCNEALANGGYCASPFDPVLNQQWDISNVDTLKTQYKGIMDQVSAHLNSVHATEAFASQVMQLMVYNSWVALGLADATVTYTSGLLTNFTFELPGMFEDLMPGAGQVVPTKLNLTRTLTDVVPQMSEYCAVPLDGSCLWPNVLNAVDDYFHVLAERTRNATELGRSQVWDFVLNKTLARFDAVIADAEGALDQFNCQYLGTTLEQSVAYGLCSVVMPDIISLGVCALVSSIASVLAAWVLWHSYRYYSDLLALGPAASVYDMQLGLLVPHTASREGRLKRAISSSTAQEDTH